MENGTTSVLDFTAAAAAVANPIVLTSHVLEPRMRCIDGAMLPDFLPATTLLCSINIQANPKNWLDFSASLDIDNLLRCEYSMLLRKLLPPPIP